ncbi:MAG: nitronate monooxygenase, partial [Deltaproteobacteria bacterium]|nr:nitronate monooxygenase [Deltaproteobacteria bacterium]
IVALALGAEGINMGTRFMAVKECPVPDAVKDRMLESQENSTVIVQQSIGNPSRVLRTPWAEKVLELELKGASFEELVPYISGDTAARGWRAGNIDEGLLSVGQVVGRINDVPTVAELMERIVAEAKDTKEKLDGLF